MNEAKRFDAAIIGFGKGGKTLAGVRVMPARKPH